MNPYSSHLLKNSHIGFATHEVIYDASHTPIDYRFIEINEAFLHMTGFDSSIVGRTILEIAPSIVEDSTDWISIYGGVATNMSTLSIERYSETLKQWYTINAHASSKGYFTVLLSPIPLGKTSVLSNTEINLKHYRNESLLKILSYQTNSSKDLLDYALDEAIHLTESAIGYIYFYNQEQQIFNLNSWSNEVMESCTITEKQTTYMLEKTGFWGEVVRQKKAIINNDFEAFHPLKKGHPEGHAPLHRFLSLPIFDNGQIVAVIGLGNKASNYIDEDILQVQQFMEDVWNIYKRKQAESNLALEKEQLKTAIESIGDGIITIDLNLKILNINSFAIEILESTNENVINKPFIDQLKPHHSELYTYFTNRITTIQNAKQHKYNSNESDEPLIFQSTSSNTYILSIKISPILTQKKELQGYIIVIRNITDEHSYNQKIQYMSYHDALTGLYNRRFFEEELLRLNTKRQLPLTIIMGDLNGLKLANDAFGHLVGDQLLTRVASILLASCREEDIVARWGGDEFVILLPTTNEKRAKEIIERIKENCLKSNDLVVDVSISLGFATKTDKEPINKILIQAEDQLYRNKLSESKSQRSSIIDAIITSLNERNHETKEHADRLIKYCSLIATKLDLNQENKTNLNLLARLHDIGKIGIPDHILLKPGPLNEDEWYEMKKHPVIGYRIAQSSTDLLPIAQLILHHHERYDGSGYPNKLSGNDIPLLSRVLSVVDAYDAMTSDRPYHKAFTTETAIKELELNSGSQFDPEIAALFIKELQ